MSLTLSNFEKSTPSKILDRGKLYMKSVLSLEEVSPGEWEAEVEGNDDYNVYVVLHNDHVTDYHCDCPYDGDPCKHVVAVWYLLRNKFMEEGSKKTTRSSKKKVGFSDLLGKISLDEYKTFVADYAKRNKGFKTDFELYFSNKVSHIDIEKVYADIIAKLIRKHSDRGYIDYRSSSRLSSDIDQVSAAVAEYMHKGNYRDAFLVVKTVLKPVLEAMRDADDSSGHIGGNISEFIHFLEKLASVMDMPRDLQTEIFDYLQQQLQDEDYFQYGDFGDDLYDIFQDLGVKVGRTEDVLRYITVQLQKLTGKYDTYRRERLVQAKIHLLTSTGKPDEANAVEEESMHLPEVRRVVLGRALDKRDYVEAKRLIQEGIRLAQKESLPGVVRQWEEELLHIAVIEKDVAQIRSLAKKFAFDRHWLDKQYYKQWKDTFSTAEWREVIEQHIAHTINEETKKWKSSKSLWRSEHPALLSALDSIYIEEGFWHRLFDLVKLEKSIDQLLRYHDELKGHYPDELVALYIPALEQFAHRTDTRAAYADLVRKMQRIIDDLPQARVPIMALASKLKEAYSVKPRRPAMLEELGKLKS